MNRNICTKIGLAILLVVTLSISVGSIQGNAASARTVRDIFDAKYYANTYPDVYELFGYNWEMLYTHFMAQGIYEGRCASTLLDVAQYRRENPDLDAMFKNDWDAYVAHYFTRGIYEGRDPGVSDEPAMMETIPENVPSSAVTEKMIDDFYANSVFVGDSVMLGFRNYAMKNAETYLGKIQFLASGSFSVNNALQPPSSTSTHPIYDGKQRYIEESIALMQADRVFLFFGINDVALAELPDVCDKYMELIGRIQEQSPDVEIYIISATYTIAGQGGKKLNNENLGTLNTMMQEKASENGWGYVDIMSALDDGTGNLAEEYCSDGHLHQNTAAYDVWSEVLREYARTQLESTLEDTLENIDED
ncbi:MAG: hypothetical protein K2K96_03270 [Lachnospiraceae bacterium]|nr:hypothetical protein [Lachnospiraceae bacterium]